MDGRGPEPRERGHMLADGIALVPGKAVARMLCIQLVHERIPRRLGEDRSGGNRQAFRVAFDDALLGDGQILYAPSVDEDVNRGDRQSRHRHRPGLVP